MNRRLLIATVVTFVAWFFGSFVVHGVLLHDDYASLPTLFRPEKEAQQYFHWMLLAHLSMAGALSWIYARGVHSSGPWLPQGLRFGIAVCLLTIVPTYLIYHVVEPIPFGMAMKQIAFDGTLVILLGLLQGWLHRGAAKV